MICQESVSLKQALPEEGRCKLIVLPPKGKHKYGATLQCNLHKGKHAEAMLQKYKVVEWYVPWPCIQVDQQHEEA